MALQTAGWCASTKTCNAILSFVSADRSGLPFTRDRNRQRRVDTSILWLMLVLLASLGKLPCGTSPLTTGMRLSATQCWKNIGILSKWHVLNYVFWDCTGGHSDRKISLNVLLSVKACEITLPIAFATENLLLLYSSGAKIHTEIIEKGWKKGYKHNNYL